MKLLHSCWSVLHCLVHDQTSFASGVSPPALREDLSYLSVNKFQVLKTLEDEYPIAPERVSVSIAHNRFLASTMKVLGGGESQLLAKLQSSERRGGGTDDGWKYVQLMDREYTAPSLYELPVAEQARRLGITRGCLVPRTFWEAAATATQNLDANPGPTFKALGFNKKRESLALAMDVAREVVETANSRPIVGYLRPRYGIAGRSKLSEKSKFREKAELMQPFGRAVFMADQHEALVANRYAGGLLEYLHDEFKVIVNGFNKFGEDPTKITSRLKQMGVYINSDLSQFDMHCCPRQMKRAFDIIRYAYDVDRFSDTQDDRILDWLEDELIFSEIVLPTGRVIKKRGGVPTGSGLTALVDSIINSLMWFEVLWEMKIPHYQLFVQGDDNLLGLQVKGSHKTRHEYGEMIVRKAAIKLLDRFGQIMSPEKTTVATNLFVRYAQPRVSENIQDHSRKKIREYQRAKSLELGRKLTFDEKFILMEDEPVGPAPGATHRWTYVFDGCAKFLSHFFKVDPTSGSTMCVRPTFEVINNLLHPEGRIRNIDDHIERLSAAFVENMGNHHVTNHIMHYLYDAWIMRNDHCYKRPPVVYNPRRAWYRHIDEQIDLMTHDLDFLDYWRGFERRARKAHTSVFGGRYAEWGAIRALRRGKTRYKVGGPLSRYPTHADIAVNFANQEFVNALGLFGFNLWANPSIRTELLNRALTCIDRPVLELTSGVALSLNDAIKSWRVDYESGVI